VRHVKTYGTGWGGYALIEVDDPEAFARYQVHHIQNYSHFISPSILFSISTEHFLKNETEACAWGGSS